MYKRLIEKSNSGEELQKHIDKLKLIEEKQFFIEFFLCNPRLGTERPILGQNPDNKEKGVKPLYLMVKCGSWGEDASQLHRFFGWNQIKRKGLEPNWFYEIIYTVKIWLAISKNYSEPYYSYIIQIPSEVL